MLTVLEAATSQRLATLDALRVELGVTGAAQDDRLTILIDRASGVIAAHCGRTFGLERVQELVRHPVGEVIVLSRRPALAAVLTTTNGGPAEDGWTLDGPAGLLIRLDACGHRACGHGGRILVTYSTGYILPGEAPIAGVEPLPVEIEQACLMLATSLQASAGRDPLLRSETVEGVGASAWLDPRTEAGALPMQVAALLSRHRRGQFG